MTSTYLERLGARTRATGTVLCLGLDPDSDALPPGFGRSLAEFQVVRMSWRVPAMTAVGLGGIAAILWLMIFKPF